MTDTRVRDKVPTESAYQAGRLSTTLRDEFRTSLSHPGRQVRDILSDPTEISVAFQPIVHLSGEEVMGVEALARFPSFPSMPVQTWFLEADSAGMRTQLEVAALRAALIHLHKIPAEQFLSINASPQLLCSPLFDGVLDGLDLRRIVIEVTEQTPVHEPQALLARLDGLRRRGARVAIDDVGTGFASFGNILALQPDFLKLDRELTSKICSNPTARALARALVSLSSEIGACLIVEGVETDAERRVLLGLGVPAAQGYLFGRPGALRSVASARRAAW